MIISSPKKDFYVKAAMFSKHQRMKELNEIESELIVADQIIHNLKNEEGVGLNIEEYETQISQVRNLIKEKKLKLL